jgi:hypothetical protein
MLANGNQSNRASSLRAAGRLLRETQEPPLGAHLITPRLGYTHHGVYVGDGSVIHYSAFACRWHRGPVEKVSLSRFAHGHSVWFRPPARDSLQCDEIVRRAHSRIGENQYRVLSNNCEHFSEWCVRGVHYSPQVDHLLAPFRRLCHVVHILKRRLIALAMVHRELDPA